MKLRIRWPIVCTRCGRTGHYAEDCPVPLLGISDAERDLLEQARRDRNAVLGIVFVLMAGYFLIGWIGLTP